VGETLELLARGLDDARIRVPGVEAADPAGEVDEGVPVYVHDGRAVGLRDHDRQVDRERLGDHLRLAVEDLATARPGNIGSEVDRLGRGHGS
jgi:hypothetical protein